VYVVHADSARATDHSARDEMLDALAAVVKADDASRLVVVGDFNAGSDDTGLARLSGELDEPAQSSGGPGFTWPSALPLVRLGHVFVRGLGARSSSVLRASGSDHRGIVTDLRWSAAAAG
jgi:vancomycin resistance protein VanJ